MRIAVIGSGITGLSCASALAAAGLSPVVLDKGRGVGGRAATRRLANGQRFDHGAGSVIARGPSLRAALSDATSAGAAHPINDDPNHRAFVGTPGMSSIPKHIGRGLEIKQGIQVTALHEIAGSWHVQAQDYQAKFDRVVLTVPAPQVAPILGDGHPLSASAKDIAFDPCLTLMAVLAGGPQTDAAPVDQGPLERISCESAKPGRPAGDCWVVQADAEFSRAHLETSLEDIPALLLPHLLKHTGHAPDEVHAAIGHRWRYAHATRPLGTAYLGDARQGIFIGGDWCLGREVEHAWDSGRAIAEAILDA
ncbi:MAG: FAD-dependent oxidoreductase [Pseudomonadota bacterium]